ncbi:MAG: prepilin peptidase [Alphaproteobacteria bacterium]|nr:MAG: prepilin peptidase [Alphaproteobacteria bacterium]
MTPPLLAITLAVLGLIAGSFIGLVSLRLPQDRGVIFGRSRCGGCDRPLPPQRLIPVISYLLAKGRCRDCGAAIPWRYPVIELVCAGVGVWAGFSQPDIVPAAFTALLGWQLVLIAVVDAEHFWLPDILTLPLLATGLTAAAILPTGSLLHSVIGAAVGFLSLWLLATAYRRLRQRDGLGGGDPTLLAAGGAWVGWIGLPSVLLWASAAALSLVAARLVTGRSVSGQDRLPFGPFLAIGIWMTWLIGPLGL